MATIETLKGIMTRLRSEGGCPWDREQTLETLRPFVIEEAYEVADAIEKGNWQDLKEELGDLLFLIVFLARVAEEEGLFDLEGVMEGAAQKIMRRHPHVFGEVKVKDPKEVEANWDRIKEEEKGSILEGIPRGLPALLRAQKLTRRAQRVGFDWEGPEGAAEKVREELGEVLEARGEPERLAEEVGDLLFSAVNLSRLLGVDAEDALHRACDRFAKRFRYIEERLKEKGRTPQEATLEEMDRLWDEAKRR